MLVQGNALLCCFLLLDDGCSCKDVAAMHNSAKVPMLCTELNDQIVSRIHAFTTGDVFATTVFPAATKLHAFRSQEGQGVPVSVIVKLQSWRFFVFFFF